MDELPTMQWLIKPPERLIQNVLLTFEGGNGKRRVEFGWVDTDYAMGQAIAYMIIPHMVNEPKVWKSQYRGDDLPVKSGQYICCEDCKYNYNLHIYKYWFDARKQTFGGSSNMIAYMDIPAPYSGVGKLHFNVKRK